MVNFDEAFLKKLRKLLGDDKNEEKHPHYKKAVELADEMSWHVYGTKPEELLKRVRPREDPEITRYRLDSYEPITQSICKKAIAITHKVFNSKLYSIRFKEDAKSQELKQYSLENYPRFNSVVSYLANFAQKKMFADPYGVFLVQSYDYVIKGSERVQPIVTVYSSKNIFMVERDYVLLFDKKEKDKEWYFTYVTKEIIQKFSLTVNGQQTEIEDYGMYKQQF